MRTLIPAALLPLLCATALAQAPGAHWTLTTTPSNPPQRRENAGAASLTHMYVFGGKSGSSGGTVMNDLWSFDGATWTQMNANGAAGTPPARDRAGVTWDFARNVLVVFGGKDAAGLVLGDTWEWDPNTNTWANVTPATSPSARQFTALSYDPVTSSVLMFGGLDGSGTHLNDTWIFAGGGAWVPMTPSTQPPVRRQHHLVTRLDFADVLLFGGQDATLSGSSKWRIDTWSWNGTDWTQIVTANTPAAQVANDAAYDQLRQRVVLAGGNGTGGTPTALISEFDSITNDWIQRPLDPGIYKVSRYFAAYVPALGKTYKVSGQALNATAPATNTYDFQSDPIADASSFGSGCTGSAGPMTLVANSLPWSGRTFQTTGSGFAAGSLGFGVMGFGTQATPLSNLHPAGGAGCDLLVSTDAVLLLMPTAGQAVLTMTLPNGTAFAGLVINSQMLSIELNASFNITAITSTNAIAASIGAL